MYPDLSSAATKYLGTGEKIQGILGALGPVKDPQRTYNWEIAIEEESPTEHSSIVKYYAISATLPSFSQEVIQKHYMGAKYYFTGRSSSQNTFRISFWDNQDLEIYAYMYEWMAASQRGYYKDHRVLPKVAHRNVYVKMLDTTSVLNKRTFGMSKCVPVEISPVTVSYGESTVLQLEVTFRYVTAEIQDKPGFIGQLPGPLGKIADKAATYIGL